MILISKIVSMMGKKKKTQIIFHKMILKVKMGNSNFPSIKKNPRQEEMRVKIKEIRNRGFQEQNTYFSTYM
jgi:hypothetical protein